jgi:hypothetical protein
MRPPDAFDMEDAEEDPRSDASVVCRACGADGLSWHHTGVRWILVDEDARPHVCKPSADDFDEVAP